MCISKQTLLMSDFMPSTRILSPTIEPRQCTHKEYGKRKEFLENGERKELCGEKKNGEKFTELVCTQCRRVSLPHSRSISIRLSMEDEEQWVHADDLSATNTNKCQSHGLCRTCFNDIDADLSLLSLDSPRPILNKSLSSPDISRSPSPPPAPRVLVVDDNRLQRQIHKRMVDNEGCECEVAISGAQAIDFVKKGKYSVILMDLVMSPQDGWTTSRAIRALSSSPSSLSSSPTPSNCPKIVAVTGLNVDEKLREECRLAGMDDVVQKPISPAILKKLLKEHTPTLPDR